MNHFENAEGSREVEQLQRLAIDAYNEGQYLTMERLLEQAVVVALRLNDLSLMIQERYCLALAQRMQGKYLQAIITYTWLIGLATDPNYSPQLTDEDTLWYLAAAFMDFVESGRFLPEMLVEQLLHVIDDGLYWMESIGKPEWAAGLHLLRGRLLERQGALGEARQEMEGALALARRNIDAPGYTLPMYQLELADLLRDSSIGAYVESANLAEEVLEKLANNINGRQRAYQTLAYARLALGEYSAALSAASECLILAQTMESTTAVANSYELLGRIYRETGKIAEAAGAIAQEWLWARRQGSVEYCYNALANCALIRLMQAQEIYGLPAQERPFYSQSHFLVMRRLQSVQHFIGWASSLAAQLDRARGHRSFQDELDKLLQETEQLKSRLAN